ncbi:aminomethyltransferase [Microbacterium terrae]|uniref:Aminomethyltransferase n=1 Tax=Microbacterium terrae TaxID=69369 RepID=A0A0M2H642_9MICO|nr:glycine cleavage system aminomethyltransferase GcvT [Microbacterium terrae]KJL40010.1 Aminomethyltransferase [Microbacterium terrae]MBP1076950.1 aminomethyltransferase [Microbacterium terrae]GLJ99544.1 aminomethyltransferase [Microbacterium terrae]
MAEPTTPELRTTALHAQHTALGASFTDFGGWLMPVRYTSDLAEHHAVRTAAGLFDISHMAEFVVTGPDAAGFLDHALAGAISPMRIGKAKYSLVLADSGGIVDDVIVYRLGEERFLVIANAGNRDAVAQAFAERSEDFAAPTSLDELPAGDFAFVAGSPRALVEDITDRMSLIAVQGPQARAIIESVASVAGVTPALADLGYYAWATGTFGDDGLFVARTGYTGEDGFELLIANHAAESLWNALLEAGEPFGLVPAGLAARDTLRLEAGMPLYGHELSLDMVPAQAGLGRVVAVDKADFVGKSGLAAVVASAAPVLVGLSAEGRRAGRAGYAVFDGEGPDAAQVGEITSGALSPTLGHPIAMAFVSPAVSAVDTVLYLDVRGTRIPATVTALPFYRRAQ